MLKLFKIIFILSSSIGAVALTGCQSIATKPHVASAAESPNQFSLQGKIGVKSPQQSGSAFFVWEQNEDQFDIELSGILGIGKTQISGQPGQVSLNSTKTGLITAETPEELLERATGWQAPITHLIHWIQAKPATLQAQLEKDQQQRITQINEDGWNIQLSYNDTAQLPNRLILQQQLESGKENRITMVIQNR
ncbi:MAG: lipoprotein insertase outer membrane protein LolB [Candidatus Acinetobacter avistercoris]|uniref:lipoprotein insertase outer membrane protein LolB n=1 Tax=Acinetobacter sp. KS-LM10 TaxID=3120518 RepID=UPI001F92F074|nr:lipoprotein insertase outer membrane protein LolB [Candidatus Acinetobacter avistercoris]